MSEQPITKSSASQSHRTKEQLIQAIQNEVNESERDILRRYLVHQMFLNDALTASNQAIIHGLSKEVGEQAARRALMNLDLRAVNEDGTFSKDGSIKVSPSHFCYYKKGDYVDAILSFVADQVRVEMGIRLTHPALMPHASTEPRPIAPGASGPSPTQHNLAYAYHLLCGEAPKDGLSDAIRVDSICAKLEHILLDEAAWQEARDRLRDQRDRARKDQTSTFAKLIDAAHHSTRVCYVVAVLPEKHVKRREQLLAHLPAMGAQRVESIGVGGGAQRFKIECGASAVYVWVMTSAAQYNAAAREGYCLANVLIADKQGLQCDPDTHRIRGMLLPSYRIPPELSDTFWGFDIAKTQKHEKPQERNEDGISTFADLLCAATNMPEPFRVVVALPKGDVTRYEKLMARLISMGGVLNEHISITGGAIMDEVKFTRGYNSVIVKLIVNYEKLNKHLTTPLIGSGRWVIVNLGGFLTNSYALLTMTNTSLCSHPESRFDAFWAFEN